MPGKRRNTSLKYGTSSFPFFTIDLFCTFGAKLTAALNIILSAVGRRLSQDFGSFTAKNAIFIL